jgi:hypothetical protein
MIHRHLLRVLVAIGIAAFTIGTGPLASRAWASWPSPGTQSLTVGGMATTFPPVFVSDGDGGTFVAWLDEGYLFRAQHYDAEGVPLWASDGMALFTQPAFAFLPSAAPDGTGGLLFVWFVNGDTSHVYAQRLSSAGVRLWGDEGMSPVPSTFDQRFPTVLASGDGGALVLMADSQPAIGPRVRAQRLSAEGVPQWGTLGVELDPGVNQAGLPIAVSDGAFGAHVAWLSFANYAVSDGDYLYQHVSATGALATPNAQPLCTAPGAVGQMVAASAPDGGAVFAWHDQRDAGYSQWDIYAQRFDAAGVPQWPANGLAVCAHTWDQGTPSVTVTNDGVAWCAWVDDRFGAGVYSVPALFAQALSPGGTPLLEEFGERITQTITSTVKLSPGADGDAIAAWTPGTVAGGLRAQKLSKLGGKAWPDTGAALGSGFVNGFIGMTPIGGHRTAALWFSEAPTAYPVRMQQVGLNGVAGGPSLAGVAPPRADDAPGVRVEGSPAIAFARLSADRERVRVLDAAGRAVRTLALARSADGWRGTWDLRDDAGRRVSAGLYFVRAVGGGARGACVVVLR